MKKKKLVLLFLIAITLVAYAGGFSKLNKLMGLKNDNKIENTAEDIIEIVTGTEIELTPED